MSKRDKKALVKKEILVPVSLSVLKLNDFYGPVEPVSSVTSPACCFFQ